MKILFSIIAFIVWCSPANGQYIFGGNILDDYKAIVSHYNSNICANDTTPYPVEDAYKSSNGKFIDITSNFRENLTELSIYCEDQQDFYQLTNGTHFHIQMEEVSIDGRFNKKSLKIRKVKFNDGDGLIIIIKLCHNAYRLKYQNKTDIDYTKMIDLYRSNIIQVVEHYESFIVYPEMFCEHE